MEENYRVILVHRDRYLVRKGITNMRVCDGLCHCLPFPDNSFDVVMSGHVVGDFFREEVDELTRITKPGGRMN